MATQSRFNNSLSLEDYRQAAERAGVSIYYPKPRRFNIHHSACCGGASSGHEKDHVWVLEEEGRAAAHCYTCPFPDSDRQVRKSLGLPEWKAADTPSHQPPAEYVYQQANGKPFTVYRLDCVAGQICGFKGCVKSNTKHIWQKPKGYIDLEGHKARLLSHDQNAGTQVVWAEGEKAAGAIYAAGYDTVNNASGAKNAGKADYSCVKDRNVVMWPDADRPAKTGQHKGQREGRRAVDDAARALLTAGVNSLSLVDITELGAAVDGQDSQKSLDAADLDADTIRRMVDSAIPYVAAEDEEGSGPRQDWYSIGEWYGQQKVELYRFDRNTQGYWAYEDNYWHLLLNNDHRMIDELSKRRYAIAQELTDIGRPKAAEMLASGPQFRSGAAAMEITSGLRMALQAPPPEAPPHLFGANNCVVDLRNSQILPHKSEYGLRSLSTGRYLPEKQKQHWEILYDRFGKVFAQGTLQSMIELLGLAMTGLSQSYRALVMVTGPSGTGKGGSINVISHAFGRRSYATETAWLTRRGQSDIDTTTADILEYKPDIISLDELGEGLELNYSRVLSVTGNAKTTARRAFGSNIQGRITSQVWTTAVSPPEFPASTGMRRRLAVLPTLGHKFEESGEVDEPGTYKQELADAIITLSAVAASSVYLPGYYAPEGDAAAKANTLNEMDEVTAWLEKLPENWAGTPISEVLEACRQDIGQYDLSATLFGRRVSDNNYWQKVKATAGRHRNSTVLQRRNPYMPGIRDKCVECGELPPDGATLSDDGQCIHCLMAQDT